LPDETVLLLVYANFKMTKNAFFICSQANEKEYALPVNHICVQQWHELMATNLQKINFCYDNFFVEQKMTQLLHKDFYLAFNLTAITKVRLEPEM
jgi:hypothetical protein